jgi:quinol monooxygenase YgiN
MYGLMGRIRAHEGQGSLLLEHLLRAADQLSGLEGCYLYVVSRATDDENSVWVTEVWRNQAEHQASLQHKAIQALIASARPLIESMSDRTEFLPVGGKGLPGSEARLSL